ncbi:MAG: hypothetical protein EZS28_025247 [Streblomastix strix]|uniref:Uncharacterized protein n=1 Tax=Streblomastix strix TaxID=222440 RepID=A0A5J4V9U6_9EUKA|nr:MAG: hypothetical protein EZS28_025247 [Streblomastix strix]
MDKLSHKNVQLSASVSQINESQDKTSIALRETMIKYGGSEENIKKISHSLVDKETSIEKCDNEIRSIRREINRYRQQYDDEHKTAEDALSIQSSLINASAEAKAEADDLQKKVQECAKDVDLQKQRAEQAEKLLSIREKEVKEKVDRVDKLLSDEVRKAKEITEDQGQRLMELKQKWMQDLEQKKEREIILEELTQAQNQVEYELAAERDNFKNNTDELNAHIKAIIEQKGQAEDNAGKRTQVWEETQNLNQKLHEDLEAQIHQHEKFNAEIATARNEQRIERKMLHEQLHALRIEQRQLKENISTSEQDITKLKRVLDDKQKEITFKQQIAQERTQDVQQHTRQLSEEVKQRGEENESLRKEIQRINSEIAVINARQDRSKTEIQKQKDNCEQNDNESKQLYEERRILVERVDIAQRSAREKKANWELEKKKIAKLEIQINEDKQHVQIEGVVLIEKIHKLEDQYAEEVIQAKNDLIQAQRQLADNEKQVETIRTKLEGAETVLQREQKNTKDIQQSLEQTKIETRSRSEDTKKDGDNKTSRLEERLRLSEQALKVARQDADERERILIKEKGALNQLERRLAQIEHDHQESSEDGKAQQRMLNEQAFDAQSERDELHRQLSSARVEAAQKAQLLVELERDVQDLSERLSVSTSDAASLREEMNNVARLKQELHDIYETVRTETQVTESERAQLREEVAAVEKELYEARERLQREISDRSEEVVKHTAQMAHLAEELALAKQNSQYATRQMRDRSDKHTTAEADARSVRAEYAAVEEQRHSLEADLTAAVQHLENYRNSLTLSEEARENLRQQLQALRGQMERESNQRGQEIISLRSTLRDLQDTLAAKEQRLQETELLYDQANLRIKHLAGESIRSQRYFSSASPSITPGSNLALPPPGN